jgi:beta-xylosidase
VNRRAFLDLIKGACFAALLKTPAEAAIAEMNARLVATGCPIADPFCIRREDGWYLVGTQHARGVERRRFSMFFSEDLLAWKDLGPVLIRPDYDGSNKANYWAPELIRLADKYYFYYTADSFGDPERRFVRVAQSDRIDGPYVDCGTKLTDKPSIDGHPYFVKPEEGYLFYCGNEGNPNVGQLLVDRFVSPTRLENNPQRVFPDDKVEWEEGPFVIRHSGAFYLFSSMGNWRDGSYHVRVAQASTILGPWKRLMQNGEPYRLLHSAPKQSGPGHNSMFEGPDGHWWICYHAWDEKRTGRYPWVAPVEWDSRGYPVVHQ